MGVLPHTTITVKLSKPLAAKLDRLAKKCGVSRSEIIRTALESLDENSSSSLDAVADLVGAITGPGDLSTNPKHMEGFGRDHARRHRSHRRAS